MNYFYFGVESIKQLDSFYFLAHEEDTNNV
jgi:hypothetical protein